MLPLQSNDKPEVAPGLRILVADDDRQVRRVFRIGLERAGFHVIEAVDGEDAITMLQQFELDALLLDISLPKLDGYGVLSAMGAGACRRVPVVVATGHHDPDIERCARELGANDVVTKPIEPRLLASRIKAIVGVS